MINQKRKKELYNLAQEAITATSNKIPIRKGCQNHTGCFCSGDCMEIIGWEESQPKQFNKSPIAKSKEQSHFEDIEEEKTCTDIGHKPPMFLQIPQGKRYIHICPACNERTVIQPQQIQF